MNHLAQADYQAVVRMKDSEIARLRKQLAQAEADLKSAQVMQRTINSSPVFARLILAIADREGISIAEIMGPSQARHIAHPRQELMSELAYEGKSHPTIGRMLNRDPSTVTTGIHAHRERIAVVDKPVDAPGGGWVFRSRRGGA